MWFIKLRATWLMHYAEKWICMPGQKETILSVFSTAGSFGETHLIKMTQ
jgi:hypothetical protein